jgi:hypothetical protein
MNDNPALLPSVDEGRLATILGLELPHGFQFEDSDQRKAARVITDAAQCKDIKKALSNGSYWVHRAYEEGFQQGRADERNYWIAKISALFGF